MSGKHLVVGVTGGIGRATAMALIEMEQKVVGFARDLKKAEEYFEGVKGMELVEGDAGKVQDIENALRGVDVIHYCVNMPFTEWESDARKFFSVTVNAAINHNLKVVFPGNIYVYGYPQQDIIREGHPHAANTKKGRIRIQMENMLEHAYRTLGLRYTIVRMPDFYGPWVINGLYDKIFLNALKGKKITWYGDLDAPIDFIYIEDAGKAMAMAGTNERANGMSFNVPGYDVTTARKFLKEIIKQSGKSSGIKARKWYFSFALAGIFNKMAYEFKELLYMKKMKFIMNGELFRTQFGEIPSTPYEEGIKKTLEWVKQHLLNKKKK